MKKLLYTFLLGLMVISCNKNEESVLAPVLEQEVQVLSQHDIDDIVSMVIDNLSNYGKSTRGASSNKGDDYIALYIFTNGDGFTYMTLLDESNDDLCLGDQAYTLVYFDNSQGDGSILQVEQEDGTLGLALKGNWTSTFAGANNTLLKLDANLLAVGSADFDDSNSVTITE